MSSYPLVKQLPPVIETHDWDWETYDNPLLGARDFFVGTDDSGNAWLTKMRGSFYGYREIVFERLVQQAGWLCQSSSFAILGHNCLPRRMVPRSDCIQLVTRLLREHEPSNCAPDCPIASLRGDLHQISDDPLRLLAASRLEGALNLARREILASALGGNEPADCLTTTDHQVFLIDGEQMFATKPTDVRETSWWVRRDGSPSHAGRRLTREICATIGSLADDDLESFLESPNGLKIEFAWDIRPLLYSARDYGLAFARSGK